MLELKRDDRWLSEEEIDWSISAYTTGTIADYQMGILAVFIRDLDAAELTAWTGAILHVGQTLDSVGV